MNMKTNWATKKGKIFFPKEHLHTNKAGAELNAQNVVEGIR